MYFLLKRQIKNVYILCFLLWCLASVAVAGEMESARHEANIEESRRCLITGVYYLVNAGDRDTAEGLFRRAIFYGSFSDLSVGAYSNTPSIEAYDNTHSVRAYGNKPIHGWIAAEAFYFLGKINYERAISQGDVEKNIAWAKKYLRKAFMKLSADILIRFLSSADTRMPSSLSEKPPVPLSATEKGLRFLKPISILK